jgi:hypothetical protein
MDRSAIHCVNSLTYRVTLDNVFMVRILNDLFSGNSEE